MTAQAQKVVVLGAGEHARVVLSVCKDDVFGCLAPQMPDERWPANIPWLGDDTYLEGADTASIRLLNGIGSIGSTAGRRIAYERARSLGFSFVSVCHPQAIIAHDAMIGTGAQIMAGAIVQIGTQLSENVLVNTGAIIDHDCIVEAHAHIATGVVISGGVRINHGAHIGAGASVRQGVTVGPRAIVGAGAVIIDDVSAGVTVVGNPAREIKRVSELGCE